MFDGVHVVPQPGHAADLFGRLLSRAALDGKGRAGGLRKHHTRSRGAQIPTCGGGRFEGGTWDFAR